MFRNFKMVGRVVFGPGCFNQTADILADRRETGKPLVFLVDQVFEQHPLANRIPKEDRDILVWVDVTPHEPKTGQVDDLVEQIREQIGEPGSIIGIGGGCMLDIAKAVSVMLTNPGKAHEYQGWDIPQVPAVHKVGIPTLSGTGAEVSRTCVLTGPEKKLGINSDYSVYDQIILDPELIAGAPTDQRFFTGMDCYIHCVESLEGTFLNSFSKAYGEKAMDLCREVFLGDPDEETDGKLMMASFSGGMSIAWSQVGVAHALSYGLAFLLGVRHGIGNCIVFDYLDEFYPEGVAEFRAMMDRHGIVLPRQITKGLSNAEMEKMVDVALGLAPLWENALGPDWAVKMTRDRIRNLYERM